MSDITEMAPTHSNDFVSIEAYNNSKHRAVMPRGTNWQLCQKIDYAIWSCPVVNIDVRWSKNRFAAEPVVIHIQNIRMENIQKAFQFLKYICDNARMITKLCVNMQVSDMEVLNSLLRLVMETKNICLEEIQFRRRYVGQQFSALVNLMRSHARTLRVIGKIGLGEAVQAFGERMKLERCSLMNFDLIDKGEMESADLKDATHTCIRRLSGLGTTFAHLSLTAYSGIQISRQPMLFFLRACKVESLRLTMQKGIPLPAPAYPRPLLHGLRQLELVGQMGTDGEARLSVMFPDLEHFDFQYVDLATGPLSVDEVKPGLRGARDRTVSEAISETDRVSPIELDYDNDRQEDISQLTTVSTMAVC